MGSRAISPGQTRKPSPTFPHRSAPHEFTILYDSEHNVIGEYSMSCGGHSPGGTTIEEAKEAPGGRRSHMTAPQAEPVIRIWVDRQRRGWYPSIPWKAVPQLEFRSRELFSAAPTNIPPGNSVGSKENRRGDPSPVFLHSAEAQRTSYRSGLPAEGIPAAVPPGPPSPQAGGTARTSFPLSW